MLAVAALRHVRLFEVPLTLDVTAWYAVARPGRCCWPSSRLALYGFHTSLAGKPVFGRSLLED